MSVNGVTGNQTTGTYTSYTAASSQEATKTAESTASNTSAVYESSKGTANSAKATKKYTPDKELIAKLKADSDAKTSQLKSIVEQMMSQQTNAYGKANNAWQFLAKGNYKVDAATAAQAKADIAEDGYHGVSQTSQRILDFATALTGGDPSKIEKMRSAFEKGFKMAEKKWGGKLPDISYKTYDAVMTGFDKLKTDADINK